MMTLTKDDLLAIEGLFLGKFESIDKHLEVLDDRMEGIEGRMDGLEGRMDGLERRMDSIEEHVGNLDMRMERVESDISSLKVGQMQMSKKLNEVSLKVDATYQFALENWGQIEESKARLTLLENYKHI